MNNHQQSRILPLSVNDVAQISGGIVEKEGLYPRKPGDQDFLVYVDGVLIGTTYGTVSGGTWTGHGIGGEFNGTINGRPFP